MEDKKDATVYDVRLKAFAFERGMARKKIEREKDAGETRCFVFGTRETTRCRKSILFVLPSRGGTLETTGGISDTLELLSI